MSVQGEHCVLSRPNQTLELCVSGDWDSGWAGRHWAVMPCAGKPSIWCIWCSGERWGPVKIQCRLKLLFLWYIEQADLSGGRRGCQTPNQTHLSGQSFSPFPVSVLTAIISLTGYLHGPILAFFALTLEYCKTDILHSCAQPAAAADSRGCPQQCDDLVSSC